MSAELEPGSLLRGKYRVVRLLGQGGMGRVIEAHHIDLDKRVAVKVLHPELRANADLVDRFLREGRAASKIEGEHVARVFDVDRLDDGTPFLVMEFLEGHDLSTIRRTRTPLPIMDAIEFILQACTAIREAHERGIIHRDIKPANLFLTRTRLGEPSIKVLDFGISKLSGPLDTSEPSLTKTSLVMGSAEFMSPEQMLSTRNVDHRTDIWALGVVLYELLTSLPPFVGETMTQVCAMVMSQPPPAPSTLRADISPQLERVVLRCLEKDREARYATVDELVVALRSARDAAADQPAPFTSLIATPRMSPVPGAPPTFLPTGSDPDAQPGTALLPDTGPKMRAIAEAARRTIQSEGHAQPSYSPPTSLSGSPSGSLTSVPVSSEAVPMPPKSASPFKALIVGVAALATLGGGLLFFGTQLRTSDHAASASPVHNISETSKPAEADSREPEKSETAVDAAPSGTMRVEPAPSLEPTATTSPSVTAKALAKPSVTAAPAATLKPKKPLVPTATAKKPNGID